ncbi:MAG: S41 family peptidase [Blastocatellales bacterium]
MKAKFRSPQLCVPTLAFFSLLFLIIAHSSSRMPAQAQGNLSFDRDRGRGMLKVIKDDIKKNYYDPNFRGIDLDARFKAADEKMQQAQSLGQVFGIIAQVLLDFDDSHTFFLPPSRTDSVEYGWQMQAIGDKCYVAAVKPGSDAEAKGLQPGDLLLNVAGFKPTREMVWKINYLLYSLRPMPALSVALQKPNGEQKQIEIQARIKRGKRVLDLTGRDGGSDINALIREAESEDRLNRHRYIELGEDAFIWKMPQFDLNEGQVDDLIDKAKKRKALILDLRGNGGGAETTLKRLASYFVDKESKVGDLKGRKEMKPLIVKSRGADVYTGKLIILVDSQSGSASEVFARLMQLEKRATVIGDRTAGAVMRSEHHQHQMGNDTVFFYGVSVTDADLIMTDGKSLERVGVAPDESLLPSASDLAAKRDPVLSRAAELVGVKLPADKAGAMFPIEWRK